MSGLSVSGVTTPLTPKKRLKAGHYEILGETYAKFEFFENGWNPYSRFLDVDKVDLLLRRIRNGTPEYREVQVKYGKLYDVGVKWEKKLFDVTSWRFFKADEFDDFADRKDFIVSYVLAHDTGYSGDIFNFRVNEFINLLRSSIPIKNDPMKRKMYLSRCLNNKDRWVLRTINRFDSVDDERLIDVSNYRRNFNI